MHRMAACLRSTSDGHVDLTYPCDGVCPACGASVARPGETCTSKALLLKHLRDAHGVQDTKVTWICHGCRRRCSSYRGAAAHYPRCKSRSGTHNGESQGAGSAVPDMGSSMPHVEDKAGPLSEETDNSQQCPADSALNRGTTANRLDDSRGGGTARGNALGQSDAGLEASANQSPDRDTEINGRQCQQCPADPALNRGMTANRPDDSRGGGTARGEVQGQLDAGLEAPANQSPDTERNGQQCPADPALNRGTTANRPDDSRGGGTARGNVQGQPDAGLEASAQEPSDRSETETGIDPNRTHTDAGSVYVCEECNREFGSKAGKQQHRRHAHADAYNASLPEPSQRNRFTADVIDDLARAGIEWPGRAACGMGINQYVHSRYPAYNVDSIAALRKKPKYKEAELKLRRETEAAAETCDRAPSHTTLGNTPHVAGRHEGALLGGSPLPDEAPQRRVSVQERATRPESLTAKETMAWDYYDAVCDGGDMNALYEELMNDLAPDSRGGRSARPPRDNRGPEPPRRRAEPANRNQRKRARYALHQNLYRKNPSALMSELRQPGASGRNDLPDTAEAARVYGERFGSESPQDNHPFEPKAGSMAVELTPFSEGEVLNVIKGLGAASAPGPDGVKTSMIVDWGVQVIRPIVSSFLWTGKTPDLLRVNRTTLIPKKAEPAGINDYRPITIGQMMNRIYTKLLTQRLSAKVHLNSRQKAFVPVDGCSEHLFVVSEAVGQCRKRRKECNLVFLDLAKAFDMVSHRSIQRALGRFGVGPRFAAVVEDLYSDITTVIRGKQGPTEPIRMARGVKQGCPLSPLLFNMVMDELMDNLGARHELQPGPDLCGFNVLAFADDLVLASGTVHGMNWLLARVQSFFEDRSMTVNAAKSHTIRFAPAPGTRTVKVVEGTTFKYGEEPIKNRKFAEVVKYLGLSLSPTGLAAFTPKEAVRDLGLIRGAALKPAQKLDMIRRILLPSQMHALRLNRQVLLRELTQLDREVRKAVRGILHLPPGTPTAVFYMKPADGGLALPEVTHSVGVARLRRLVRLQANEDRLVALYARASVSLERELRHWKGVFGVEDTSSLTLGKLKKARSGDLAKVYRATPVGRLFDSRATRTGHPWLTRPKTLTGGEFVTAVKMVTENLPTRMNVSRGRERGRRECRRCQGHAETQLHVLNECKTTREAQIRRHNWVCGAIRRRVKEVDPTTSVRSEFRVTVDGEELRPDLVIVRGHRAVVIDVAVCYDNRAERLRTRYKEKIEKYEVLRDQLREQWNARRAVSPERPVVTEVTVDAVVLGARGLLLPETSVRPLRRLGINSVRFLRYVQEGVVRGSVMVWRTFTC